MMYDWYFYPAFFGVGLVASVINSIAGGGSTISLPVMIFLGLPPTVANGTNRIGLFVGNLTSALNLRKHGLLNGGIYKRLFWPTLFGALLGIFFLVNIGDKLFQGILSVAICLVVLMSNLKRNVLGKPPETPPQRISPLAFFGFLMISIYGCIVQVGVGFLQIFALSRYTGLDLLHVNAIKNALTTTFLFVSTIGLIAIGKVNWGLAICVSLGAFTGGSLGCRLQRKKGNEFIRKFVSGASLVMAAVLVYDLF
ncbi:MAG: sulfite exporter TauE/SafE family protein [Fibrobacteraceae bacterium]|nr:sulfite exporter TauE/SafE family protein [Fibrobacteraceae bacterium]